MLYKVAAVETFGRGSVPAILPCRPFRPPSPLFRSQCGVATEAAVLGSLHVEYIMPGRGTTFHLCSVCFKSFALIPWVNCGPLIQHTNTEEVFGISLFMSSN